ncbi:TetR/AcrR family transcriptional regulator [Halomonas sp. MCCC 1A11062]|uniref:TetR/AcrR family transcriptional regulator n=1 Tax=Halomonas sp. MCCC 1A11062 TaxID=2733485 RepID=UPI001F213613|nr:TetR/AcrR family transcriptional regulator [Halomonas sp. MCCC 1A11062]MCE8039597.1 TetR/AcrR family transcriptional regulator [Halomonas sp. MCCC 1A11062]
MGTETKILDAAAQLLEAHGPAGLTTRTVCEVAGVKAPTLYHHFGDKDGLERALVRRAMAEFMQRKRAPAATADLLEQLRFGWDVAVEFALDRPALYIVFAQQVRSHPELAAEGYALMREKVQRLVDTGRFRLPVDEAARAVWAASQGALSLVGQNMARKDVEATSRLLFDAVVNELSQPSPSTQSPS